MIEHGCTIENEERKFNAHIRGYKMKEPISDRVAMKDRDKKKFDDIVNKITQNKLREAKINGRRR